MTKKLNKIIAIPGQQFLHYQNGKKFFYLADTWWYGLTNRWTNKDFQEAVDLRKKQGFTAIQLVIGVPPEIPFWSHHAHNDGGHPFLADYSPNPEFFKHIDDRIQYLIEQNMVPVIFGGWGYHIDQIGVEKTQQFWKEIIARYSRFPVIYSLCGEVDLFPNSLYFKHRLRNILQTNKTLSKTIQIIKKAFPTTYSLQPTTNHPTTQQLLLNQRLKDWQTVAKYIKTLDPITPLTVHPHSPQSSSQLFHKPSWLDIDAIQSGHSDQADKNFVNQVENITLQQPFLDLEAPYEGIFEQFLGKAQIAQMKLRVEKGSAGYTYGAQGLWNLATEKDNFMKHWGKSDWTTARTFSGAEMLAKIQLDN